MPFRQRNTCSATDANRRNAKRTVLDASYNDGPFLRLEAAFDAVCVTARNYIHVLLRKRCDATPDAAKAMPSPAMALPPGDLQATMNCCCGSVLSPMSCMCARRRKYICPCEGYCDALNVNVSNGM
jgi:hypothetical protein